MPSTPLSAQVPNRDDRIGRVTEWVVAAAPQPVPRRLSHLPSSRWMSNAACHGYTPLMFCPEIASPAEVAEARTVCFSCPVQRDCALFGLTSAYGLWGGLTTEERSEVFDALPEPVARWTALHYGSDIWGWADEVSPEIRQMYPAWKAEQRVRQSFQRRLASTSGTAPA